MNKVFYTQFAGMHFVKNDHKKEIVLDFNPASYDLVIKKYFNNIDNCIGINALSNFVDKKFDDDKIWNELNLNQDLLSQIRKIQYYTHQNKNNYNLIPEEILKEFGLYYLDVIEHVYLKYEKEIDTINKNAMFYFDMGEIYLNKLSKTNPFLLLGKKKFKDYEKYIYSIGKFNFLQVNYSHDTVNGLIVSNNRALSNIASNDPIRETVVSRFGAKGSIMMFDYNAIQPRILFALSGSDVEEDNSDFYEKLAKKLKFNGTRDEFKLKIFQIIFSGKSSDENFKNQFPLIYELKEKLLADYKKNGYISSINGKRRALEYNELTTKTINSFIQMAQSDIIHETLHKVTNYLLNKKTKLIGLISDSFMFDVHESEFDELIQFCKDNLQKTMFITNCFLQLKFKSGKSWSHCS